MYLRNSWYVMAWARELSDKPLARTILEENIVLFRTASGKIAALEDRCPHRHLPLSMGQIRGEALQCGYHGLSFNTNGKCIAVPSQKLIPPNACTKSYRIAERHGWIWIWMGETEKADEAQIPDFSKLTDPAYAATGKTNHVKASYRLLTDNLLDLSHVGFVHTTTIGNAPMGEKGMLKSERTENGVRVKRLVENVPPPPTYIKTGVLPAGKNIDRWQDIEFSVPSFVQIHVGGAETGTGALEGQTAHGLNIWVLNAMTPETKNTTFYFWASVRQHALDSKEADALFLNQVSEAFEEDRLVLEAQQRVLDSRADSWSVALQQDTGSIEARRVLDRRIADENRAG